MPKTFFYEEMDPNGIILWPSQPTWDSYIYKSSFFVALQNGNPELEEFVTEIIKIEWPVGKYKMCILE